MKSQEVIFNALIIRLLVKSSVNNSEQDAILFWCDRNVLGLHASASLECGSSKHAYHVLDVKLKRKCDRDQTSVPYDGK